MPGVKRIWDQDQLSLDPLELAFDMNDVEEDNNDELILIAGAPLNETPNEL